MSNLKGLMTSLSAEFFTPPDIVQDVQAVWPIGLDPCGAPKSFVDAVSPRAYYVDGVRDDERKSFTDTKLSATLVRPWAVPPSEQIYVNPPYGHEIGTWLARCAEAARDGHKVTALVPARTDTGWFQTALKTANALAMLAGRLRFWTDRFCVTCGEWKTCVARGHVVEIQESAGQSGPAPFPSALLHWGTPESTYRFMTTFVRRRAFVVRGAQ
jgi:hypothetical protein